MKDLFRVAGVRSRLHLIQASMSDGHELEPADCEAVDSLT